MAKARNTMRAIWVRRCFEIYPRGGDDDSTVGTRIGFQVASVDEVIAKLQAANVKIVSAPKDSPWGRRAVVVDPDGHRVELTEPIAVDPK